MSTASSAKNGKSPAKTMRLGMRCVNYAAFGSASSYLTTSKTIGVLIVGSLLHHRVER